MSPEITQMIEAQRVLYLKSFITIFGISIFILTITYFRSKNIFPIFLSIALFLNLGNFIYLNQQYKSFVKKKLIPSLEMEYDAKYINSPYLTIKHINKLHIFYHKVTDIKSQGYFKNNKKIIEFIKILSIKQDTEQNDIENILFNGKVIIEDGNDIIFKRKTPEYFEAGENIKSPNPTPDGKKYTFIEGEKLFKNLNFLIKYK